jgi:DNA modification methylase
MQINKIYTGDCLEWLRQMPDNFIDCCVTSPPYYGLRDYGTAQWDGGDENCKHEGRIIADAPGSLKQASNFGANYVNRGDCLKCGAIRIDNQSVWKKRRKPTFQNW